MMNPILEKLVKCTDSWIHDFTNHIEFKETGTFEFDIVVTDYCYNEWTVPVLYEPQDDDFYIDCGGDVSNLPLDSEHFWISLALDAQHKICKMQEETRKRISAKEIREQAPTVEAKEFPCNGYKEEMELAKAECVNIWFDDSNGDRGFAIARPGSDFWLNHFPTEDEARIWCMENDLPIQFSNRTMYD